MTDEYIVKEDLLRWREALARRDAADINPDKFTAQETIDAFLNFYKTAGEIFEEYELVEDQDTISPHSGRIVQIDK